MGLTVNRQMAKKLTVKNGQPSNEQVKVSRQLSFLNFLNCFFFNFLNSFFVFLIFFKTIFFIFFKFLKIFANNFLLIIFKLIFFQI